MLKSFKNQDLKNFNHHLLENYVQASSDLINKNFCCLTIKSAALIVFRQCFFFRSGKSPIFVSSNRQSFPLLYFVEKSGLSSFPNYNGVQKKTVFFPIIDLRRLKTGLI